MLLAPSQAYILLAVATTVGSIAAALVQSLLPRKPTTGAVVPEQSLAADRRVILGRRLVVGGFSVLLILAWVNVVGIMLKTVAQWSAFRWLHYVGLLFLLIVFVTVMAELSDRLKAVSTNFVEAQPGTGAGGGPIDGSK